MCLYVRFVETHHMRLDWLERHCQIWQCLSINNPCHCEEERRSNLVVMQINYALTTRLPRCTRNDIIFIISLPQPIALSANY